jgi:hypothetical protein
MTPNDIFNLVDPVIAMQRYFPYEVNVTNRYKNPFRIDNKPTCFFGWSKSGRFVFYDPAKPDCSGDAIKIVMLKYNLNFGEAMQKINDDFNLGLSSKRVSNRTDLTPVRKQNIKREFETKVKKTYFQIHLRNWNKKDQEYWSQYGIDIKLLKKYNILPVKKYYTKNLNQSGFSLSYDYDKDRDDSCYCYKIGDEDFNVKLYRPLAKDTANKWRSNTTVNDVQGLEQLTYKSKDDTLIVASSMKDLLTLISLGYDAIAPQSESIEIPKSVLNKLKKKYKRIIFIYDADETGHNYSIKHAESSKCEYKLLEKVNDKKDLSDIRSTMTEEEFDLFINKLLNDN